MKSNDDWEVMVTEIDTVSQSHRLEDTPWRLGAPPQTAERTLR